MRTMGIVLRGSDEVKQQVSPSLARGEAMTAGHRVGSLTAYFSGVCTAENPAEFSALSASSGKARLLVDVRGVRRDLLYPTARIAARSS